MVVWNTFYLGFKHFIHKTNPMDQQRPQNVWPGEQKMKALFKFVLQREIKQGMLAKRQVFLLLYCLVKGFDIVSITKNLVVKYLLNLYKTTLLRF